MGSIQEDLDEFRSQLEKGSVQHAYSALISYMLGLRTRLAKDHPDHTVSGLYQQVYWKLVKDGPWDGFRVVAPAKGIDSIIECDLAAGSDLDDPDGLTEHIEEKTMRFADRVLRFLADQDKRPPGVQLSPSLPLSRRSRG